MTMLMLPVLPFVLTCVFTAFAFLWSRFIRRRYVMGFRLSIMCENSAQVKSYFLRWLTASVPFLNIVYNGICMKAFNTFSCIQLRSGVLVMAVAPEVTCWTTDEHSWMVVVSSVVIILYVAGVPAY
jgi:hypothetical protein